MFLPAIFLPSLGARASGRPGATPNQAVDRTSASVSFCQLQKAMIRDSRLVCSILFLCIAIVAFLETARRSWTVHSWLSATTHGHPFYRVVRTGELSGPIPTHYPIHTLESQRLVYSGNKYLGYFSKYGFFVPDGQSWDSAWIQDGWFTVVTFWLEPAVGLSAVIVWMLFIRKIGQQNGAASGRQPFS
jgi:hypothetical protein